MKKKIILQINVTLNRGSHGVIAEEIGTLAQNRGWESWIAYGREPHGESKSNIIKIGEKKDFWVHALYTRLFDMHGLSSTKATRDFVDKIKKIQPDIIHLHNIHGYYINYEVLFNYLSESRAKIIWTLHDCWPMTGHCSHFMFEKCEKWKTGCSNCQLRKEYPSSVLLDRSHYNYEKKKSLFLKCEDKLTLVPVSKCVENYTRQSFFKNCSIKQIYNGIDLEKFKLRSQPREKMILGVANVWDKSKGLYDFFKLREILSPKYKIVIVGLSQKQLKILPPNIIGVTKTSSVSELVDLYSKSSFFVNPTYNDNFPTTNIEALACGTPVITYRTGGSPEAIDEKTGIIIGQGDIIGIKKAIEKIEADSSSYTPELCRERAVQLYNKNDRFNEYIDLYESLL